MLVLICAAVGYSWSQVHDGLMTRWLERAVPSAGDEIVILSMTLVMMTALSVTRETERGTMESLLATPAQPIEVMIGKLKIEDVVLKTELPGLDIAPANPGLGEAELILTKTPFREQRLKTKLADLNGYDFVVIDTPPSLGNLTLNAIIACNTIIIPIQTQFFALEGMMMLTEDDLR